MTAPKRRHTQIQARIHQMLMRVVSELGLSAEVHVEAPYEISKEPFILLRPDVSLIMLDRVKNTPDDEYMQGAPDLAVEVMSPSDTVERVYRKVGEYLAAGGRSVWVVSPENQQVHWYAGRKAFVYGGNESSAEPDVFGTRKFSVQEIFC